MGYIINQNRAVGFFSSFNIVVGALKCLSDNSATDFYVNWQNPLYQTDQQNLFDKYFYKQNIPEAIGDEYDAVEIGNIYEPTFDQQLFLELNKILHRYNYFNNDIYRQCASSCISLENCLGVHVRGTDHHQHGELLTVEAYFVAIDKKLIEGAFENILLITDEEPLVNRFRQRYGDKLHTNVGISRSTTGTAIHYEGFADLEKLVLEVMSDAISLSKCKEIIITASNVAAYALMLNPHIKFNQIDLHIKYT